MSHERILGKLRQIKKQCELHRYGCDNCIFVLKDLKCEIKEIVYNLYSEPANWDLKKIEEALKNG